MRAPSRPIGGRRVYRLMGYLLSAAALSIGTSPSLGAQRVRTTGVVPCKSTCPIDASLYLVLGSREDPALPMVQSSVAPLETGGYLLGPTHAPGELSVYDERGTFLRSVGREGQGPGEYEIIGGVYPWNDGGGLVLSRGRISFVDREGAFTASFPLRFQAMAAYPLQSHEVLVEIGSGSPALAGVSAVRLDSLGTVVTEYRSEVPDGGPLARTRQAAIAGDGSVLLAAVNSYYFERFTRDGALLERFVGSRDWFPAWTELPADLLAQRAPTRLARIAEDSQGRIWLIFWVPDPDWHPSAITAVGWGDIQPWEDALDSLVEVVDPATGRLLGSERFDVLITGFVGRGLVSVPREDADGFPRMEIWRLSLD